MSSDKTSDSSGFRHGAMPLLSQSPVFIGFRYLLRKKLSYLAMAAVAVSVGTLIVVMSVMSGFESELRDVVRGYLSDMTIKPPAGRLHQMDNWEDDREDVLSLDRVTQAAPFIQAPGLIRVPRYDQMEHVMFRGMDPELEPEVTDFGSEFVQHGGLEDLRRTYEDEDGAEIGACLVGSEMAKQWSPYYQLYLKLSEELDEPARSRILTLFSKVRREKTLDAARERMDEVVSALSEISRPLSHVVAANAERALRDEIVLITATEDLRRRLKKYVVAGVFKTGRYDYDSGVVLLSLDSAMDFVRSGGAVTGLNLKLDDFSNAPAVKARLSQDFRAETWEDQQHTFLEAVQMERTLMGLILSFVGLLAGFCIFAILIMTVYEKRRDIGILKSVGYTSHYIAMTFLVNGGAIGLIGAAAGVAGGLLFAAHVNQIAAHVEELTGWTPFPPDVYYFSEIPADTGVAMPLIISLAAVACSLLFSVLPAIKAARMDPVDTLRFE
ncbi:MAG: FtsX-like permease family protein [Planctomycetota bacterium]